MATADDAARTFEVFFYGLYMDAAVLTARGVVPREPRLAFIEDHAVRLGAKAMLLPSPGARAYGMLYRLSHRELDELYANAPEYGPQTYAAHPVGASGRPVAALSMVHVDPPAHPAEDAAYRLQWTALCRRLGLPGAASDQLSGQG